MAFQRDESKLVNEVKIVGYLKETNLKQSYDEKTREQIVSGTITLMVGNGAEHRIYCYARRYWKPRPGETTPRLNPNYDKLLELTPERATSLASALKIDPNATLENSAAILTKVVCYGEFNERFFVGRDGTTHESIEIRPTTVQKADERYSFNPSATFKADVYVDAVVPEYKDGAETGRYILKGCINRFDGTTMCVDFVTNGNDSVNGAVSASGVGETIFLKGNLVRAENRHTITDNTGTSFGEAEERTVVDFVDERVITGGQMSKPEGEPRTYTIKSIVEGRAAREILKANAKPVGEKNVQSAPDASKVTSTPAPADSANPAPEVKPANELTDFSGISF